MRKSPAALVYYIFLLILSVGYVAYRISVVSPDQSKSPVRAIAGILDLREQDLRDQVVPLRGEFEFYWSELLEPDNFDDVSPPMTGYMEVPGLWNGYEVNGRELSGMGYATFRLLILLPETGHYQVNVRELDTAYRLWINGSETGSGKVGKSAEEMIPDWTRREMAFYSGTDTLEMVLQMSNFHHRKGGPEEPIYFGATDVMKRRKVVSATSETFVLGFMFLTVIFHLGLYFFRMKDRSNLYFSLLALVICLRVMLTGEKIFLDLFPFLPWEWTLRIEYMTIFLPPALILLFFHSTFPQYARKWAEYALLVVVGTFLIALFLLPPYIYTYLALLNQAFILASFLYIIWFLLKPLKTRQTYIYLLFAGAIFFGLIGVNELLYYNNWLHTGYLLPVGLLAFIFSTSYGLSGKFTNALDEAEELRNEMERYSHELENIVSIRTRVTEEQKNQLEKQTAELKTALNEQNKLLEFKEMMSSILVHDMKNPLGAIISLEENSPPAHILLAKQSGYQLLNLLQNLMETQKFEEADFSLRITENKLKEQVEKAFEQVAYLARIKKIELINEVPEELTVYGDRYMLERILTNLVMNAVKFTSEGGKVTVSASRENAMVKVKVKDTGVGIDPKFQQKIFEKYTHMTDTSNIKSTGLGLAFCRQAVEAQGGTIGVESEPGRGSTFWFTITANKPRS
ncbi:MAG: ATP-binding protein [Bacteroidales bacterium]